MSETNFEDRNWENWTVPTIIDVQGVPTAYRRAGEGDTLVYLHGGGGTREWSPLHAALAEHFDVVAPEHPGFGDTPRGTDQDTWEDYVLHYDAFFRALGLENFHLVGTSLGSWLAANLAVYYPDRYKSITLVTPMGVLVEDDPFVDIFRLDEAEEIDRMFNGRDYGPPVFQVSELDDQVHRYMEMSTAARLVWSPRHERRFPARLARVTIPALVIGVDDDRLVGTGQAARFAEILPNSTLVVVHGPNGTLSGHGLPMEQPADVVAEITAHVATIV